MRKDDIKSALKIIGGFSLLGLACILSSVSYEETEYDIYSDQSDDKNGTTYADCIREISNSNIVSWYKSSIIKIVDRDESSDYYDAVISIAKSPTMSDWYKENAIKNIT
jgi:hypothetical protein